MPDILSLYDEEVRLYYAYLRARVGQTGSSATGKVSYHNVRLREVRDAKAEWLAAHAALRAAGGTLSAVRALLEERGAQGARITRGAKT